MAALSDSFPFPANRAFLIPWQRTILGAIPHGAPIHGAPMTRKILARRCAAHLSLAGIIRYAAFRCRLFLASTTSPARGAAAVAVTCRHSGSREKPAQQGELDELQSCLHVFVGSDFSSWCKEHQPLRHVKHRPRPKPFSIHAKSPRLVSKPIGVCSGLAGTGSLRAAVVPHAPQ